MTDKETAINRETFLPHLRDAVNAALEAMEQCAEKSGVDFEFLFLNATGFFAFRLAELCPDAEQYERVLNYLIANYANGGKVSGFNLNAEIIKNHTPELWAILGLSSSQDKPLTCFH